MSVKTFVQAKQVATKHLERNRSRRSRLCIVGFLLTRWGNGKVKVFNLMCTSTASDVYVGNFKFERKVETNVIICSGTALNPDVAPLHFPTADNVIV